MRPSRIDNTALIERLLDVFRTHGYEGASLSIIAEATGLQRASLYHRFPGGKEEMVEAALSRVDEVFSNNVLAPLSEKGEPAARVRKMARRLGEFFSAGRRSCVLDTLSLGEAASPLQDHVRRSFAAWVDAMTVVARDAGARPATARRRAEDALVSIQGGLVFSRATGDTKPFERALADLPATLVGLE